MKYYTKEWFRKSQTEHLPSTPQAYRTEYSKNFPCPPEFMKTIDYLHDSEISSVRMHGRDLVITAEAIELGTLDAAEIILKNAVILKHEPGEELGWLYDEIYPAEKGYELHVLFFQYGSDRLYELTAECENIEIRPLR